MQRHGDLLDRRARGGQGLGGVADGGVDVGLGHAVALEALAQEADAQAVGPAVEALDVGVTWTPTWRGSRPSSPASTSSAAAQSATERAIGPTWSIVSSIGKMPV